MLLCFLAWGGYTANIARNISPLTKEEQLFPDNHRISRIKKIITQEFDKGGPIDLEVNLFWGVKDINKQNISEWDPRDIGEAILDDQFDMAKQDSQSSLAQFCVDLRGQSFVIDGSVDCWIEDFKTWFTTSYEGVEFPISPQSIYKFDDEVYKWATKDAKGKQHYAQYHVGFINKKMKFSKVVAKSIGKVEDPKSIKEPLYNKW